MPSHEYTARDALELLLQRIESASPELALRIQLAVDEGKDISMEGEEPVGPRRGRKRKKRYYRKNVPLTDEEALKVALEVLKSHLIESRKIINATHAEFTQVGLAPPMQDNANEHPNQQDLVGGIAKLERKAIEIEIEPETVQEKKNLPDLKLIPIDDEQLRGLEKILTELQALTNFG